MTNLLTVAIAIAVVFIVAKFLLHLGLKTIIGLVINSVIGYVVLYLINLTGIVSIPLNIVTCLVAGFLGIPGVIILVVLSFVGVLG